MMGGVDWGSWVMRGGWVGWDGMGWEEMAGRQGIGARFCARKSWGLVYEIDLAAFVFLLLCLLKRTPSLSVMLLLLSLGWEDILNRWIGGPLCVCVYMFNGVVCVLVHIYVCMYSCTATTFEID